MKSKKKKINSINNSIFFFFLKKKEKENHNSLADMLALCVIKPCVHSTTKNKINPSENFKEIKQNLNNWK
jgi:hypothetical protein